jgi:hypothetical protein
MARKCQYITLDDVSDTVLVTDGFPDRSRARKDQEIGSQTLRVRGPVAESREEAGLVAAEWVTGGEQVVMQPAQLHIGCFAVRQALGQGVGWHAER